MTTVGVYEYNPKDLIGHGAFAVVYKGRIKAVSRLSSPSRCHKISVNHAQSAFGSEMILAALHDCHTFRGLDNRLGDVTEIRPNFHEPSLHNFLRGKALKLTISRFSALFNIKALALLLLSWIWRLLLSLY